MVTLTLRKLPEGNEKTFNEAEIILKSKNSVG
jgi:hypothetical protein